MKWLLSLPISFGGTTAPPPLHPAPPVPAASREVRPPEMDGVHRQSWLAAVDALRCPGPQCLVMDIPCQCVMAFAVGCDLQSGLRVPDAARQAARAASDSRVDSRSPPTYVPGTSRSTPRKDFLARRPRWWPGRTAVQIGRSPAPPAPISPTACRRQDAACGHPLLLVDNRTRAIARRLNDQRAHGVPSEYRQIKRPFPLIPATACYQRST